MLALFQDRALQPQLQPQLQAQKRQQPRQQKQPQKQPQKHTQGFTLIELLVVSSLSALMILSWSAFTSYQLATLHKHASTAREHQQLRAVGLWLSHELERARDNGSWDWLWYPDDECLLYGEEGGVRMWQSRIQWRGGLRGCQELGWVSLTDSRNLHIENFVLDGSGAKGRLRVTAKIDGQLASWEYSFNGPIQLR